MAFNTFGEKYRLTTFGESHGEAIGGIIDGMPPGIVLDHDFIQAELRRRRPGQSRYTTSRQEPDEVEFLSGIWDGKTTGCPIGFAIRNTNQHSKDYDNLNDVLRPSHADFTYLSKYGIRDHRGGGRASARITVARCVGGALAKLALAPMGIEIKAYVSQIGHIKVDEAYDRLNLDAIESNEMRCPNKDKAKLMAALIESLKDQGDSIGGTISCVIKGCPSGLGNPEFDKLHARLGYAMLGINAAKGFEYGKGFDLATLKGSQANDTFYNKDGVISTLTNHSGGIQGGISNGQDIYFKVAFKPVATILIEQETVDVNGNKATIQAQGRHDCCVLPRAVPIVESMAAMVILDGILLQKADRL